MPKTPTGAKRPADVIGNAVHVMRIATGQIEDETPASQGKEYARKGGPKVHGEFNRLFLRVDPVTVVKIESELETVTNQL